MLTKRIIPCLDIKNNKVVKGIKFNELGYVGDAVELAKKYYTGGADEICLLDVMASVESRHIVVELVRNVAESICIPFSVGGGIRSIEHIREILYAGAEKVSIGTSAVLNPSLITKASQRFGSQAIVISIDAKKNKDMKCGYEVYVKGGKEGTSQDALEFGKIMEKRGAGEILLNAIDSDGTREGYNLKLTRLFSESLKIPIIASGGAGKIEDMELVFKEGKADAALAASIFHYNDYTLKEIKKKLKQKGIGVRI